MTENFGEIQLRRSKRNFSDLTSKIPAMKNSDYFLEQQQILRPKMNSIKINRNKLLPPDFFPRSQSIRAKPNNNRPSISEQPNLIKQTYRKGSSQYNQISPQKTSFFGFFEENLKNSKKQGSNVFNFKRQFESRDEPKREKMYFEHRNLTPMMGIQRNDLLMMFSDNYDQSLSEALTQSKKKRLENSPRKESHFMLQKQLKVIEENPEREKLHQQKSTDLVNMSTSGGSEDIHNITFFNAKSTSFPPIHKNGNLG